MKPPPNWLRWFLILPAAICAYLILAIIGSIVYKLLPIPAFLVTLYYSVMSPMAFVIAGVITAPSNKFATAISVTVINAMFAAVIVTMAVVRQTGTVPIWWLVVSMLIGIVATIYLCVEFKHEEED
jgi:hypothetical protein